MIGSRDSIKESLAGIDPYDFEYLVAEIWEQNGWRTEVTSGSQDRGIDVVAKQDEPIPLTVAIQAKAYSQDNKIGSEDVRKYRTLYEQEENVDRVAIATTGRYTRQAEELAADLDMSLLDLDDIAELVAPIGVVSLGSIFAPINPEGYEVVDIPYPSEKGGCPKCSTLDSLWEAEVAAGIHIMVCESCGATWESKANGNWKPVS